MRGKVSRKRPQRWIFGILTAAAILYCDKAVRHSDQATVQMTILTLWLVGVFFIELPWAVRRKRCVAVLLSILALHYLFLYSIHDHFPFQESLSVVVLGLVEALIAAIGFVTVVQRVDPAALPLARNS